MKGMVDAFAGYARMPRAKLEALDLNALVRECWPCTTSSRWDWSCTSTPICRASRATPHYCVR